MTTPENIASLKAAIKQYSASIDSAIVAPEPTMPWMTDATNPDTTRLRQLAQGLDHVVKCLQVALDGGTVNYSHENGYTIA